MDKVEKAKELLHILEGNDKKSNTDVALRNFLIQERLESIKIG